VGAAGRRLAAALAIGVSQAAAAEPPGCDFYDFRDAIAETGAPRFESLVAACWRAGRALPQRDDGASLLFLAAHVGGGAAPRLTRRLLDLGVDPRGADRDGLTPARMAARFGCGECLKALLAVGADLHERDPDGASLLHEAGGDAVPVLIAAGLSPALRDAAGNVPLHRRSHPALRAVGVNVRNDAGLTPLHYAALDGSVARIDELLALGADPALRTTAATRWRAGHMSRAFGPGEPIEADRTPLDLARWRQRETRWVTSAHDAAVARLEAVTPRRSLLPWR
jgi:ankyrin repeat protein